MDDVLVLELVLALVLVLVPVLAAVVQNMAEWICIVQEEFVR